MYASSVKIVVELDILSAMPGGRRRSTRKSIHHCSSIVPFLGHKAEHCQYCWEAQQKLDCYVSSFRSYQRRVVCSCREGNHPHKTSGYNEYPSHQRAKCCYELPMSLLFAKALANQEFLIHCAGIHAFLSFMTPARMRGQELMTRGPTRRWLKLLARSSLQIFKMLAATMHFKTSIHTCLVFQHICYGSGQSAMPSWQS